MPDAKPAPRSSRPDRGGRRAFTLRKLHSLAGVLPVGLFVVTHLITQSSALRGRAAYEEATADRLPLQPLLEIALVLAPLTFHAVYGLVLTARSRPTVGAHPTNRNWMYTAQRVTGVIAFVWIVWHIAATWLPGLLGHIGSRQVYSTLASDLSTTSEGVPVTALVYVVGLGAASFHLANGLWGAGVSWGVLVTRRAQAIASAAAVVAGLTLFLVGTNVVVFFTTGARLVAFGPDRSGRGEVGPCVAPASSATPRGAPR